MSLQVEWTAQFKKDYKNAMKRNFDIESLDNTIRLLANCEPLPENLKDHALKGNLSGFRECHIAPDWLLIYAVRKNILTLTLFRTGSHSDLFGK